MSTATTLNMFHDGELAIQQRAGATAQGRNSGRMISDTIIPGAIKFAKKQPFIVIGSADERNNLWASIIVGRAGFLLAEPHSLDLDLTQARRFDDDPVWQNLVANPRVGILVIDLRSRARLRVNGRVEFPSNDLLHMVVEQAYPNCPRYIQRRNYRPATDRNRTAQSECKFGKELTGDQQQWIANADTLFVASEHPAGGVDASHRGGNPGFIQIIDSTRLRVPDYAGNGMYNTLGNFAVNPRAGLIIPDFEGGRTLQLTGRAEILWDVEDVHNETGGTNRYLEFEFDHWIQINNSLPGTSEFLDYSPHNPSRLAL